MAGFDRSFRQKVIDEYLNSTRRNVFVPQEFLEWLRERPDHKVYDVFFGKSDEEAAQAYRLSAVRSFVSGLRIAVRVSAAPSDAKSIDVKVNEESALSVRIPAFMSPMSNRKDGGGYYPTDPSDPAVIRELSRQAANDIRRVIERHEGVAALAGVDLAALRQIVAAFDAAGLSEAA